MAKLTADQRIIEHLKTFYQCRHIHLKVNEKTQDYKEVRSSTIRQADLAKTMDIIPKTFSSALQKYLLVDRNVLIYRFTSEGVFIPNEEYDLRKFPHSETRLGYKSKAGEKFVGEKILKDLGGRLLASTTLHKHFKITVGPPPGTTDSIYFYFVVRTDLIHLQIKPTIFDDLNGKPFTLMLAQDYIFDFSSMHFIPGTEHIQPFNTQAAMLNLPEQSLHIPSKWGNSSFPHLPNLASISITFYPATKSIWLTQLSGLWSPKYALLSEKDLGKRKLNQPTTPEERNVNKPAPILNLESWRRQGRVWPKPLTRVYKYQPPELTSFFKEEQDRYATTATNKSSLLSTRLHPPVIFDLAPWQAVRAIVNAQPDDGEHIDKDQFKEKMNSLTWECESPCLLEFQNFSVVIVK